MDNNTINEIKALYEKYISWSKKGGHTPEQEAMLKGRQFALIDLAEILGFRL